MFQTPKCVNQALAEYQDACGKFGLFASAHEGYAVLKEEVDELWDEVKKKQGQRSQACLTKEAAQVAAMALRFLDLVNSGGAK
jgi:NTP pyrophosphatase (non-canonical NTP hydrolase)